MATRPPILAPLLAAAALATGGCGGGTPPAAPPGGPQEAAAAGPPAPQADDRGRLALTLSGGPFGSDGRTVVYPVRSEPGNRLTMVPGGFRLAVHAPGDPGPAPSWGLWLFLRGRVELDSRITAETGSQIVVDGVPYAPAAADGPGSADSPALDLRLTVEFIDRRANTFDAAVEGTLLPPDGSAEVRLTGYATLPLPGHQPPTND